jgi:hypothetical protein
VPVLTPSTVLTAFGIHAAAAQVLDHSGPGGVIADGSEHRDPGPRGRGRDRLVRALAARPALDSLGGDGLARADEPAEREHHVLVDGTDDDHRTGIS